MKTQLNRSAFTLVELVVVITILAILGMIGFLSIQGYSSKSRDAERGADLSNLSKGLDVLAAGGGTFPQPDANMLTLTASGTPIGYQGYAGTNVMRTIRFGGKGLDPLDGKAYTYSTNVSGNKYQLLGLLENADSSAVTLDGELFGIATAHAGAYDTRIPLSRGAILGIVLSNTGGNVNQPAQERYDAASFTGMDLARTTSGSGYAMVFATGDSTASLPTSGTGAYTGSLFTFAYNKRADLIRDKSLASRDSSLVGYWDMETVCEAGSCGGGNDGKLKDLSGYGNNGEIIWATAAGNATGKNGKGMTFASGSYVQILNTPSLQAIGNIESSYSVVIVYNLSTYTPGGYLTLIEKFLGTSGTYPFIKYFWDSGSVGMRTSIRALPDTNRVNISKIIFWGEFQNTALVVNRQKNTCSDFQNGTKIWETSIENYGWTANTENLIIGNNNNSLSSNWYWIIDEVRIYNRVLSDSEISALHNAIR